MLHDLLVAVVVWCYLSYLDNQGADSIIYLSVIILQCAVTQLFPAVQQ